MPTLAQTISTFLQIERRAHTTKQYRYLLNRLSAAIGPERDLQLVRYEDLLDWFARQRATGLQASTLAGYTNIVKAFFNWCVTVDYLNQSPATHLKRKTQPPQRRRAIPPDDLSAMTARARVHPRNYAMMLFMIDTGCRVGGLVSLTLDNLDLNRGTALLEEKGGQPHRVFFGEDTTAALCAWLDRRPPVAHAYVWTGQSPHAPLTTKAVQFIVRRLSERSGCRRTWSPHAIRHAVAEAYAKAGVPLTVTQHKLGHSHPSITAVYYYPPGEEYVETVSKEHALLALQPTPTPEPPPQRKIIVFPKRRAE